MTKTVLFQTIQVSIKYAASMSKQIYFKQFNLVQFDPEIGSYQVLPLQARAHLRAMAIKEYSPKFQNYRSVTITLFRVISRTLVGGVLLFC